MPLIEIQPGEIRNTDDIVGATRSRDGAVSVWFRDKHGYGTGGAEGEDLWRRLQAACVKVEGEAINEALVRAFARIVAKDIVEKLLRDGALTSDQ